MSMGFPNCNSNDCPCPICCTDKRGMYEFSWLNPLEAGFEPLTLEAYEAAAATCELHVRLDPAAYSSVKRVLDFDVRKNGNRGRCLVADLPGLGLLKGDRLEPTPMFPNTADFDDARPADGEVLELCFWRKSKETRTRHRNPIWGARTRMSPDRSLVVDWLHVLSLGTFLVWVGEFLWGLVDEDAFETRGSTEYERIHGTLARLKAGMAAWTSSEESAGREQTLSWDFSAGMMGKRGTQVHLKGAEGNSMLLYVWDAVLPEVRPRLRDARWNPLLQAGEALVKLLKVLRENKGAIPPRLHQDIHHTYCLRVS